MLLFNVIIIEFFHTLIFMLIELLKRFFMQIILLNLFNLIKLYYPKYVLLELVLLIFQFLRFFEYIMMDHLDIQDLQFVDEPIFL